MTAMAMAVSAFFSIGRAVILGTRHDVVRIEYSLWIGRFLTLMA